ncbi:MAG: CHAD domain-containing protein [Limisphaerales bacterium]
MKPLLPNSSPNGWDGPLSKQLPFELPPRTLRYLAGSLKKQWKRYRKGLKRCQQKFSERAVHGSRVETRRLLSILELLAPFLAPGRFAKAQAFIKNHLDTFDELRDTQVQLATVKKMVRSFPGAKALYVYLEKRETRFSRETRKNVKRIKTRRLGKLMAASRQDLKSWCADSSAMKANALLLRSVHHAFGRTLDLKGRIDPKNTDTIHRTRVAFKRLRYMIDTLADFLPRVNEKMLDAMHRYQTMMGDIQDAEVLLRCLERFLEKEEMEPPAGRPLRQELLARRQFLIQVYLDAADQLLDFWPEPIPAPRIPKNSLPSSTRKPAAAPRGLRKARRKPRKTSK